MFVLARAVTYSALFIGLLLVFVPARIVGATGLVRPTTLGPLELVGIAVCALGGLIAFWCIFAFVFVGKGTPAPFDPPRRLVVRGPYRYVRNPMYLGAGLALLGAALFYRSLPLLGYVALLFVAVQSLIVWYEEPTLERAFGDEYRAYRARVRRWLPLPTANPSPGAS